MKAPRYHHRRRVRRAQSRGHGLPPEKLGGKKTDGPKPVAVVRGTLVDKALAVGTIEPRVEVSVKSILAVWCGGASPPSVISSSRPAAARDLAQPDTAGNGELRRNVERARSS